MNNGKPIESIADATTDELTDDALDNVSGGSWFNYDPSSDPNNG
jgi:hypothetical protein